MTTVHTDKHIDPIGHIIQESKGKAWPCGVQTCKLQTHYTCPVVLLQLVKMRPYHAVGYNGKTSLHVALSKCITHSLCHNAAT